jgi:death on curing protein
VSFDPVFLSVEDVIVLHDEQLVRFGGAAGIRDLGLLEVSGRNAPNRVRMLSTSRRISLSSTIVIADPEGVLFQAMIDIAEKTMDKSGLADPLRGLAKPS